MSYTHRFVQILKIPYTVLHLLPQDLCHCVPCKSVCFQHLRHHTLEEAQVPHTRTPRRTPVSTEPSQNLSKRIKHKAHSQSMHFFSSPVPPRHGSYFPITFFSCLTLKKNSLPMGSHLISPSSFLYFLDSSHSYPQLYAFFMQINPARLSSSQFSYFLITMIPYKKDPGSKVTASASCLWGRVPGENTGIEMVIFISFCTHIFM